MTRLRSDDISDIALTLAAYNQELIRKTGCSLGQIAAHAAGVREQDIDCSSSRAAVIPLTCGEGVIEGFVHSVASILRFLGLNTLVTENADAAGLAEAVGQGADVLVMADDNCFTAVKPAAGKVVYNSEATGRGFASALQLMTGGVAGKSVLLLGAGPVGLSAALALSGFGARLSVYDPNRRAGQKLTKQLAAHGYQVKVETDLAAALDAHRIIFDASPARNLITKNYITPGTYIAAPGVPLGISADGLEQVWARTVHDPLQIGVATMIFDLLRS